MSWIKEAEDKFIVQFKRDAKKFSELMKWYFGIEDNEC